MEDEFPLKTVDLGDLSQNYPNPTVVEHHQKKFVEQQPLLVDWWIRAKPFMIFPRISH